MHEKFRAHEQAKEKKKSAIRNTLWGGLDATNVYQGASKLCALYILRKKQLKLV